MPQAIDGVPISKLLFCVKLLRSRFASGYWGITICRSCLAPNFWGDCNLQGRFRLGHIFSTREISFRLRFIIHVKHAPYCGDSASSSYTLNTPLMRRFRFIIYLKVLQTSLSIGRDRFIIRLKHAPLITSLEHDHSFANSDSCTFARLLNPPRNLSQTRGRVRAATTERGEVGSGGEGGEPPPPPLATAMPVSGVLKGSKSVLLLLARCQFAANLHG